MIQYLIIVIITIICIEIYLRYYTNNKDKLSDEVKVDIWDKIDNKKNKYYIKINNLDEDKFTEWKKNIGKIDYDVMDKYLIIKTKTEDHALAIVNLFIVYLNNEIELDYIIDNDLINRSRLKATTYKMVKIKLIELIKEGLNTLNNKTDEKEIQRSLPNHFDTNDDEDIENIPSATVGENTNSANDGGNIPSTKAGENTISAKARENTINAKAGGNTTSSTIGKTTTSSIEPLQNVINKDILSNIPLEKIQINMYSPYGGNEYASVSF